MGESTSTVITGLKNNKTLNTSNKVISYRSEPHVDNEGYKNIEKMSCFEL
jgi:hypothetical protein